MAELTLDIYMVLPLFVSTYFIKKIFFLVFIFSDFEIPFINKFRGPMSKAVGCGLDDRGFQSQLSKKSKLRNSF